MGNCPKGNKMSELTAEPVVKTEEGGPVDPAVQQAGQVINNAVAALMDIANLLRDIPKLVAANQYLAEQVKALGGTLPGQTTTKN